MTDSPEKELEKVEINAVFEKKLSETVESIDAKKKVIVVMEFDPKTKQLKVVIVPDDISCGFILGMIRLGLKILIQNYIKEGKITIPELLKQAQRRQSTYIS